ncbi:succinate dehydrogenase, partial [Bacillus paranthracis]|nr:succinate dehydrogenase [Bacillus paranthracis]
DISVMKPRKCDYSAKQGVADKGEEKGDKQRV